MSVRFDVTVDHQLHTGTGTTTTCANDLPNYSLSINVGHHGHLRPILPIIPHHPVSMTPPCNHSISKMPRGHQTSPCHNKGPQIITSCSQHGLSSNEELEGRARSKLSRLTTNTHPCTFESQCHVANSWKKRIS